MSWWTAAMAAWVVGSMPLGMTVGRMISTGQTGDLGGLAGPDLAQWLGGPRTRQAERSLGLAAPSQGSELAEIRAARASTAMGPTATQ